MGDESNFLIYFVAKHLLTVQSGDAVVNELNE